MIEVPTRRELELKFIFKVDNIEGQLDNNTIHQLRKRVAETLELSEFGEVREWGSEGFDNRWAVPAIDAFDNFANELHISYLFVYPLEVGHGNLMALVTRDIFQLYEQARQLHTILHFSLTIL